MNPNSTIKITLEASTDKANAQIKSFFANLNAFLNPQNAKGSGKSESKSGTEDKHCKCKEEEPQGLIANLNKAWDAFYSKVANTSKDLANLMVSPFEGMREGIDKSMNQLLLKGANAKQFFNGVAIGILSSMRKAFAGMVADFATKTVMILKWAATQARITAIHSAQTAARTAVHATGEAAQTGATAAGAAARGALRLGETIFHGLMVALRTGAHVLGEIAMTAATIANGLIRRAAAFLESQPYIFLASVKAASAVADIPYVGPILAPIAAATTFAALEAMAVFKQGGYTGDGPSDEVAGVVHRGEFVVPAERVNQVGLGFFETIRSGRFSAASINALAAPHSSDFQPGPGGSVIQHKTELSLATFGGEADAKRWAEGQDGETWFLNMMNKHAYRYQSQS